MTHLTKTELDEIISQTPFKGDTFPVFIETGTYRGETIFKMEPFFDSLHTIEINEKFFNNCKEQYKGSKIAFHLGNSSEVLPQIISTVKENVIFFLDGHWSSQETGRGDKDVPLLEELDSINVQSGGKALIIIDDYRLFGRHPKALLKRNYCKEDWRAITKRSLTSRVRSRLSSKFVHGDRFVICINGLKP
ncbi:MAG: hypothetical protein IPO22_13715 [Anaerolineales bacterium]|nr:hypothetical protein [Anaerolineales bacterium]